MRLALGGDRLDLRLCRAPRRGENLKFRVERQAADVRKEILSVRCARTVQRGARRAPGQRIQIVPASGRDPEKRLLVRHRGDFRRERTRPREEKVFERGELLLDFPKLVAVIPAAPTPAFIPWQCEEKENILCGLFLRWALRYLPH